MSQTYNISPKFKKSLLERQIYKKSINNHTYTIYRDILWRQGEFEITVVDETDLPDPNSTDEITLSDYDYEFISTWDGCDETIALYNDINDNEITSGPVYNTIHKIINETSDFNTLEDDHDWELDDTDYIIYGGCDIEKVA
jgi:hypothetical protein